MNTKTTLATAVLSVFAAIAHAHPGTSLDEQSRQISAAADRGQDFVRMHRGDRVDATQGTRVESQLGASGTSDAAAPRSQSGVTRAEVLADLQLHRESGLADFDVADTAVWGTYAYREAADRYAALRASPRYAALVQQYGGFSRDDSMALSTR